MRQLTVFCYFLLMLLLRLGSIDGQSSSDRKRPTVLGSIFCVNEGKAEELLKNWNA